MADPMQSPVIDIERLKSFFEGLDQFGSGGTGSTGRPAFSDAETDARRWIAGRMDEAGLSVRRDEAGNLFGRFGSDEGEAVLIGSHLDTLPGGGSDGALGFAIALESVLAMKDAGIEPAVPIEIVATSDGAGRFGGGLGARAITGDVTREWIEETRDASGTGLAEAIAESGLDPWRVFDAVRPAGTYRAFLELRGAPPAPDGAVTAISLVEAAAGILQWDVRMTGRGGHCRAVPMGERSDAFAGLAEVAATVPAVIRIAGRGKSSVTINSVRVTPEGPFEIPSEAAFSLIIEEADERTMKSLTAAFRALIERAARSRQLEVSIEEAGRVAPVTYDAALSELVEEEAERLEIACPRASAAASDAVVMQKFCPSGLLLVPAAGADWQAVEKAAQLTAAVLCRLAGGKQTEAPPAVGRDDPQETVSDDVDLKLELDDIMLSEAD